MPNFDKSAAFDLAKEKLIKSGCSDDNTFGIIEGILDLAYTAAGRYDGIWARELKHWEMAAGLLLVQEAGGLCQAIVEHEDPMQTGTIIAANGEGHAKFSRLVRDK